MWNPGFQADICGVYNPGFAPVSDVGLICGLWTRTCGVYNPGFGTPATPPDPGYSERPAASSTASTGWCRSPRAMSQPRRIWASSSRSRGSSTAISSSSFLR